MKVSRYWLKKFFDADLPDAQALAEALTFHAFEIEDIAVQGEDQVLDVKVTPNRGHDCLSHRGIARELSAILGLPLAHDPFDTAPDVFQSTDALRVVVENDESCPRYIAGYIRGLRVGPSPRWLRERLEAIGQKSINNVVDATNFIMFSIGQPLHAFDAGKMQAEHGRFLIRVRSAHEGEHMVTLDGKTCRLESSMLVIGDGNSGGVIGVAGVKGGLPASITEDTADIIIESANFDGASVRRTARMLRLRTDASQRFEQGISPELASYGMRVVVDLITHIAGGEVMGYVDVYPKPQERRIVRVELEDINGVLGTKLTNDVVADIFQRLGFMYTREGGRYAVEAPFERLDMQIPEDLIEEVGRIIGYDAVAPEALPPCDRRPVVNKNFYWSERIRERLVEGGFSEVYTSVFAERGAREVHNKVESDRPFLRESLMPGMEEALQRNKRTAEMLGLSGVRLFEIGTVFARASEAVMLAVGVLGGTHAQRPREALAELYAALGLAQPPMPGADGVAAEIELSRVIVSLPEPDSYEMLPLAKAGRYQPFSRYPFIIRDAAFWCPKDTDEEALKAQLQKAAGEQCIRALLFDRFEKGGRLSLAFRFVFQSFERTLTEEEIQPGMEEVYAQLKRKGYEVR